MSREWSEDKMIRLIEQIRERPLIWNAENEDYKKRHKRSEAFSEVADCIGVQRDEVERKWKVLQTQFRREHSKAGGPNESHKGGTLWFGYKHMSFLKDRNFTRNPSGQILSSTNNGHEDGSGNSEHSTRTDTNNGGDKTMTSSSSCGSKEVIMAKEPKKESPKRKRFKLFDPNADYSLQFDANSDDTYFVAEEKSVSDKRTPQHSCSNSIIVRDDATVYAEYIANKLRKYNVFIRADVEHKINCALHEADLKSLQHRLWQTQQQQQSNLNRREDGHGLIPSALFQQSTSEHKYYPAAERSPSVLSVASSTSMLPSKTDGQEQ